MTELQISKKWCLSCRVMKTDEKMSNEISRLTELLLMIISMIIWHWDTHIHEQDFHSYKTDYSISWFHMW